MKVEDDKINSILTHSKFLDYLKRIQQYESSREFCRHNLQHFLDTARIAYILVLEKKLSFNKELIYAAALLHDIGRWMQYEDGRAHDAASAVLAEEILIDCGYSKEEIIQITEAIKSHRTMEKDENSLNYILYYSDKKSRSCFDCKSIDRCNWPLEKKNSFIIY
jgi:uncharacterized protein